MMNDQPITLREYGMRERALADILTVVLDDIADREDVVVFGAYAVNAYVDPPRMTSDLDLFSTDAADTAEELRILLSHEFKVAIRVREVADGKGFRVYQLRKPYNRHLVDVRQTDTLPPSQRLDGVLVVMPNTLLQLKLKAYAARRNTEKGLTDKVDIYRLLRAFPEFRTSRPFDTARERDAWQEILSTRLDPNDDEEDW